MQTPFHEALRRLHGQIKLNVKLQKFLVVFKKHSILADNSTSCLSYLSLTYLPAVKFLL